MFSPSPLPSQSSCTSVIKLEWYIIPLSLRGSVYGCNFVWSALWDILQVVLLDGLSWVDLWRYTRLVPNDPWCAAQAVGTFLRVVVLDGLGWVDLWRYSSMDSIEYDSNWWIDKFNWVGAQRLLGCSPYGWDVFPCCTPRWTELGWPMMAYYGL